MTRDEIIAWLLEGDASIQYQVQRDLVGADAATLSPLQRRIEREGWGARFLAQQNPNGHWGRGFYQPKWTSTHYTLLDLMSLCLPQDNPQAGRSIQMMFDTAATPDGSVNFARTEHPADVCINGMALGYASYFRSPDPRLHAIIGYLLCMEMPGGGWNCNAVRSGATHFSFHTTISVLEGLLRYRGALANADGAGPAECAQRLDAIGQAEARAIELMLRHQLFKSDRTGEIIRQQFVTLAYPSRWHYDILRGLDYLQAAGVPFDDRMAPALSVLASKRRSDGTWPLQSGYPGEVHFTMEKGGPSRWNTLRALRVLKRYPAE